jgi:hypothetical protein
MFSLLGSRPFDIFLGILQTPSNRATNDLLGLTCYPKVVKKTPTFNPTEQVKNEKLDCDKEWLQQR